MTTKQFYEFIDLHNLYSFDSLIELKLANGNFMQCVWITEVPALGKSKDNAFRGKNAQLMFYIFDQDNYFFCSADEIDSMELIQANYLI